MVDVAVGPPLRDDEKRGAKWHPPQRALLSLPSGRLRVETPNSIKVSREEEGEYPGGELDVVPGDYVVTVHRVDREADADAPTARSRFPTEFITLTPAADLAPPSPPIASLSIDHLASLGWTFPGEVKDGVFTGQIRSGPVGAVTNLDPRAGKELGLRLGTRLLVEGPPEPMEAIHLAWMNPIVFKEVFGREATAVAPYSAEWAFADSSKKRFCLVVRRWDRPERVEVGPEVAVRITPRGKPFLAPLDPGPPASSIEDGALVARVVVAGPRGVVLDVGADALEKVGLGHKLALRGRARFDGAERAFFLHSGRALDDIKAATQAFVASLPGAGPLLERIEKGRSKDSLAGLFGLLSEDGQKAQAELDQLPIPPAQGAALPLLAREAPHPEVEGAKALLLTPLVRDRSYLDVASGAPVVLRKG